MSESNGALSSLIERYRTLLKREASPRALDESLALIQDIARSNLDMPQDSKTPQPHRDVHVPEGSLEVIEPRLRQVRLERKLRLGEEQKRTIYRIIAALTLPSFFQTVDRSLPRKRASLLLDATQVLFHQSYFVLVADPGNLPGGARKVLLEVFLRYADQLPSPADSFRIVAMVNDAMGQRESAEYFRRRSLRETPSSAHEYLTVLQSAWSEYIDDKRFGLAMLLLLEEISNDRVLPDNFDEFLELAGLTLELWRDSRRATASSA
jgi:hypothetical protein